MRCTILIRASTFPPVNPEAYLGRANTKLALKDEKGAIADFDLAIKSSIPLQPIYWKSRRLKGNALLRMGDTKAALTELRLFTLRKFKSDNPKLSLGAYHSV